MTPANFAAEKLEGPYASSKWHGVFATEQGPIFNHLPKEVCVTYHGISSCSVIYETALSFSETSGVDDWNPTCAFKLEATMTAQQFFDELNKGTNIVGIQPLALAKFLGAEKLGSPYASSTSNWHGVFVTEQGPIFNHLPKEVSVTHQGTSSCRVISGDVLSFSEISGVDDWYPLCELNLQTAMTAQQFFDELKKSTDIVEIHPPALAKFLGCKQ